MQFVADENIEREVVERLRQEGHFVWFIVEMTRGIKNGAVLTFANQQQALLITADKDFLELICTRATKSGGSCILTLSASNEPKPKSRVSC